MAIEDPISAWFARQVDRSPDRVAVVYEGRQLTYRELDFRSNRFARHLRALGVGPEGVVGLCLERNDGALIAILGILKAGGAFVPLDPESPRDRNERILDLAGARIVVTCAAL
ncbi:MAG: AMP-binding protein, partial [Polyangiaceae bacterium]|nr:AMP-binding protein [Polyangiaceae bacterium]